MLTVGQIVRIHKQSGMKQTEFSEFIGKSKNYLNYLKCNRGKDEPVKDNVTADIYDKFPAFTNEFLKPHEINKIQNILKLRKDGEVKYVKVEKEVMQLTIPFEQYAQKVIKAIKGPLFKKRELAELEIIVDDDNIKDILKVALDLIE